VTTPVSGASGDDAFGRYAPCNIIPGKSLLHHSAGHDLATPLIINTITA